MFYNINERYLRGELQMAKYTTEYIKDFFKQYDKTVDDRYVYRSSKDKVPYTCDLCGFKHSITLNNFKNGGYGMGPKSGCKNCWDHHIDFSIPLEKSFELENYVILDIEGYKQSRHCRIYYRCPQGHLYNVLKYYWYLGYRCPYCDHLKNNPESDITFLTFAADRDRITMSYIKENAIKYGFRLLSTGKYSGNSKDLLLFECVNRGHRIKLSVEDIRKGKRCYKCKQEDLFNEIRTTFLEANHTLVTNLEEEYENRKTILKCKCNKCDTIYETNWTKFGYHNNRCPKCARTTQSIKKSGSNHFNWKGGISAEPYCFDWNSSEFKEYIFERDEYKCWNCGNKYSKLVRHHIDYNKKNCDPINIITLCRSCHTKTNYNRDVWEDHFKNIMRGRFEE